MVVATYDRSGRVFAGSIHSRTLDALVKRGLLEAIGTYRGRTTAARLTAAGWPVARRVRGGAA
ncbi:hypothetical protein [Plantactinospora sp. WMMB782]|uniref:hypothetical protein n=1 Tax=Plantactinospora sp. WMMB782 TaxID=3404121 RepID=UPI003B9671ED